MIANTTYLIKSRIYVNPAAWGAIAAGAMTLGTVFLPIPQAVYVVACLLMLAGSLALLVSGHIGFGLAASAGTLVTAVGWLLFTLATLIEVAGNDGGSVYGMGTLVLMVGLLVTGVTALRARKWGAWQRFTPLAVLATFWVAVAIGALSGSKGTAYLGWWGLSWIALGAALLKPE